MSIFHILAASTAVCIPVYAWIVRGRTYAIFAAVILAFSLPGMLIVQARLASWVAPQWSPWLDAAFMVSLATAAVHLIHLVRARLRSSWFRWLISVPGQTTVAAGFMTVSDTAKWIAILGMLLGRLEIFTLLVLITPTFWRH